MATASAAAQAGHAVRIVSRSGRAAGAPEDAEIVTADAADPAAATRAVQGAVAVHHCAAPPYTDWAAHHPPLMASLLTAAGAAGAVLVNSSNLYGYGRVSAPMDEHTPQRPISRKGAIRRDLDHAAELAHREGRTQTVTLRAPDFYGAAATATTVYGDRVFGRLLRGQRPQVFGRLDVPHSWVDVADFGRAMVALAGTPTTWGRVWHLPCPPPLTQREMIALIAGAAGGPPRPQAAPTWVLRGLGPVVPVLRELAEMAYQWEIPYTVDHTAFDTRFPAWEPTPHARAVPATVAWFRRHAAAASSPAGPPGPR